MKLDSYTDAGVIAAVALVNDVALAARGRGGAPTDETIAAIRQVMAVDPPSVARFGSGDAPAFVALADELRTIFALVGAGDLDAAAARLNHLLVTNPSHPHLAKEDGVWRLHHHPGDAELVPMWSAICAEALARIVGAGDAARLGTCEAPTCDRVFVDVSKNASRSFCSTTCQNRVKSAAFRRRRSSWA